MADSAQWRRYVVVFFALTSPLPTSIGMAVKSNRQTRYNAALNQHVTVHPSYATCGNRESVEYYDGHLVRCASGCGSMRNFSRQKEAYDRFPSDVIQMGEDKCHIAENRNDQLKPSMCWLTPNRGDWSRFTPFTYSVWIKPTETQTKQSLFSRSDFQILLRDGHLEGVTYTTAQKVSKATKLTKIYSGLWTHIAIRVQPRSNFAPAHVAVFANGAFLAPALQPVDGPFAPEGDTGATGATGATGVVQITQNIRIGLAQSHIESIGCEVLKSDACASIGCSPAVRMPNKLGHRTQLEAYYNAKRAFLLGVGPDGDSLLKNCHWDRDLVARFACTYYFPPCSTNGTVLPPCRSLCTAVMENWCEAIDRQLIRCEEFPDSTDPTVCVGPNYKSDFGLYRGEIRHGLFHQRLLTDREIDAEYTGRFRRVRPLSECLCHAAKTPALLTNASLTCVADVPNVNATNRLDEGRGTHHVVEFVNDGDLSTAWASSKPSPDQVEIQINFRLPMQIWVVEIQLGSQFPRKGIVIMTNRSGDFRVTQIMSTNCEDEWAKPVDGVLMQPDSVNCQDIRKLTGSSRTPPYTIKLDLRDGRPEKYASVPSLRGRREFRGPTSRDEFLMATAIRIVFHGQPLKGGSHIVPEISVYTRCYPEGTIDGYRCLDGVCQCRNVPGVDIAKAGPECTPYLMRMIPSFGPRSGGTKVVIFGGFLGRKNSSVSVHTWIEDIAFDIEYSNDTRIYTLTPPLTNATGTKDIMNVATALNVTLESGYELRTKMQFVYKEDPVVEKIEPERSFLRGGIVQTIIGRHMDSVAFPLMTVTLVYRGRFYEQPTSPCRVLSATEMHCPTPEIQLPSGISKRDLSHFSESVDPTPEPEMMYVPVVMWRPDEPRDCITPDDIQFYIGLLFDGVPTYRNVSETLPQHGQLYIYSDPEVYEFEEEVLNFRHVDKHITIKGARLNYGCSIGDYIVTVGLGQCEVLDLQTNQLVCRPPKTKPALGQFHKLGDPRVKVVVGNINIVVGYLGYNKNSSNITRTILIDLACLLILLVLAALVGVYVYRKRKAISKPESGQTTAHSDDTHEYFGLRSNRPRDIVKALSPSLAAKIESAKVDSHRMTLGKIIGKGNFGEVHIGQLTDECNKAKSTHVAIKTIRDADSVRSVSEFLEEATMMHNFTHPNVLSLIGVVIDDNKPYVIMPLMENGDLRVFIGKRERNFTLRELLGFGHQVAKGMAYLEDARFVHRDLAARNCMVQLKHNVPGADLGVLAGGLSQSQSYIVLLTYLGDRTTHVSFYLRTRGRDDTCVVLLTEGVDEKLSVKIADFGLARDIYNDDYYKVQDKYRPLPIKWMAIEALQHSKFTTKSDVWSYGIVLWELMTRGLKPYSDVDNLDLRRYLEMGRRLEKPDVAPPCIYDVMMRCWLEDPDERPSFADICTILDDLLSDDIPMTSPDYVNYLVPVDLVGQPSPEGYIQMSAQVDDQSDEKSRPEKPSHHGYLIMSGETNDQSKDLLSGAGEVPNQYDNSAASI